MRFFICLCFLVAACGLSVSITREYIYHNNVPAAIWTQAQLHCRKYYRDLATINSTEEHQRFVSIEIKDNSGWIGLCTLSASDLTWKWSDGEPVSFLKWAPEWPVMSSPTPVRTCSVSFNGLWFNDPCESTHTYFYCYRYLILVTKLKTWEEALQYCTTQYSGLVSLPNATEIQQAKLELALTQTDDVWVALRYLDGKWFWLSESPLGIDAGSGKPPDPLVSMPSCPALPYRCGAINTKTNAFGNRDCNQKMNFLCWK